MKSYRQIVEEAKTEIPEVTVAEIKTEQDKESDFVLLDVRDEDEYRAGYIPDAVHVTRGMLDFSVENYIPDRDQKIVVYCAAGLRSLLAATSLRAATRTARSSATSSPATTGTGSGTARCGRASAAASTRRSRRPSARQRTGRGDVPQVGYRQEAGYTGCPQCHHPVRVVSYCPGLRYVGLHGPPWRSRG